MSPQGSPPSDTGDFGSWFFQYDRVCDDFSGPFCYLIFRRVLACDHRGRRPRQLDHPLLWVVYCSKTVRSHGWMYLSVAAVM